MSTVSILEADLNNSLFDSPKTSLLASPWRMRKSFTTYWETMQKSYGLFYLQNHSSDTLKAGLELLSGFHRDQLQQNHELEAARYIDKSTIEYEKSGPLWLSGKAMRHCLPQQGANQLRQQHKFLQYIPCCLVSAQTVDWRLITRQRAARRKSHGTPKLFNLNSSHIPIVHSRNKSKFSSYERNVQNRPCLMLCLL